MKTAQLDLLADAAYAVPLPGTHAPAVDLLPPDPPPTALEELDAAPFALPAPEANGGPDQVALFDLEGLTDEAGDVAIRRELEAAGLTPEGRLRRYEASTIRQVVLRFTPGEYAAVLQQLEQLMAVSGTSTHSEAVAWLLRRWKTES